MKPVLNGLTAVLLTFGLIACGEAPKGEKVEAGEAIESSDQAAAEGTTYLVDTESSQINWTGSKLVGNSHTGYIKLDEGTLQVDNGNLSGGTFVIDMTTLTDTDLEDEGKRKKLEGHLKSDDFFSVGAHPTAKFEIVKVEEATGNPDATHRITGNLTMKGITKSVTLPAKVSMSDGQLMASTPQFTIDRTQWEVMYGSSALDVVKDKVIRDEVGLKIELAAAPPQAGNPG